MTKRTFSIETAATATVVVDFEAFQAAMVEAREMFAQGKRTSLHPLTSLMIDNGHSDEDILRVITQHATSKLVKDEFKESADTDKAFYFKGIQVTTKCTPKKPL